MGAMPEPASFESLMAQGAAQHAAQRPEQALVAFEAALALQPGDANAASACATMLSSLGLPEAAYATLKTARAALLAYADGAANLAIAAENCGHLEEARAAYARALELDPQHLRSLNNTALIFARAGDWPAAISRLQQCTRLAPGDLTAWLNLADTLAAARRFADALGALDEADRRFACAPASTIRHALFMAFDGQIDAAQVAMDALGPQLLGLAQDFLAQVGSSDGRMVHKSRLATPDAYELFCAQAFDAMQECDWRDHDRLTVAIREMLARSLHCGLGRDARDTQFYGLVLPLHEDEMAQLRRLSIDAIGRNIATPMAPFVARRSKNRDRRIRVGLAAQSVHDPRFANALEQQLRLHDRSRFALHVYSPTPQPDYSFVEGLASLGVPAVEIAHMSDDESVARMRLDELDIFVDMAFDTPWCRPEIPERRVASVQIRQTTWHRHHPPRPCDYNMSDWFVHPPGIGMDKYGAVVRLPQTCWLFTNNDYAQDRAVTRAAAGFSEGALVLCAMLPALMVDPQTFGLWMKMLQALPHAVLLLPTYSAAARNNLSMSAEACGVQASRLLFLPRSSRAQMLSRLQWADLFVDALRFNANQGLADALRLGVPAVSCAGDNMASRLGGSIVRAAGLADCVVDSAAALLDAVIHLGSDGRSLGALRMRLAQQQATAPLFDAPARVRDWETAWAMMFERQQSGLAPNAFDVPGGSR